MQPLAETPPPSVGHPATIVGIVDEGVLAGLPHGPNHNNHWLDCLTQTISTRDDIVSWIHARIAQAMKTLGLVVALWGDGEAGVYWLTDLQAKYPDLKIVACTNLHGPWLLKHAWETGLRALVDIDHVTTDLPQALFGLAPGERFCSETLQPAMRCHASDARLLLHLGKSQRQALALIGEGCDNRDIAERLRIKPSSANKLSWRLAKHFDLKSRRELGALARHLGLTLINGGITTFPWFDV